MTTTTQREADERVRLPQPDTTYYAPFQGASLKYHSADQIIEYKDRCVAEALTPVAAPEAPAKQSVDAHTTSYAQGYRAGIEIGKAMAADEAAPEAPAATIRCARDEDVICYGASRSGELCPCSECIAERVATTASASDGSIYESVSRRTNPGGHAEAMAQMDEVLGRTATPSREAALLPKPWREAFRDTYPNMSLNNVKPLDALTWAEKEITDLRAALARAPLTAPNEQENP